MKVFFIESKVGINSQVSVMLTAHKADTSPNNPATN